MGIVHARRRLFVILNICTHLPQFLLSYNETPNEILWIILCGNGMLFDFKKEISPSCDRQFRAPFFTLKGLIITKVMAITVNHCLLVNHSLLVHMAIVTYSWTLVQAVDLG